MTCDGISLGPETWEVARAYASQFGPIPSSFTTVIRHLMNEHSAGLSCATGLNRQFAIRLLKTPSLFAPMLKFWTVHGKVTDSETEPMTPEKLVDTFAPFELASLFGFIYLIRRAKPSCSADEWDFVAKSMAQDVDAAVTLGRAIPAIGAGTALLEAFALHLGHISFLRHDLKGFKEHRRHLKKKDLQFDYDSEFTRWGCVHPQIASVVIQSLGFGILRASSLVPALTRVSEACNSDSAEEERIIKDLGMARLWRESVLRSGRQPGGAIQAKYYPDKSSFEHALLAVKQHLSRPHTECWLYQGKDSPDSSSGELEPYPDDK